jgi:hypothetical protein
MKHYYVERDQWNRPSVESAAYLKKSRLEARTE